MDLLNIFEMILLSSLIGSVIVLMILIIKGLFRNKLNATFHYYLWLILLIKLIIPVGPQTPLNITNLYDHLYVQNTTNENPQINSSNQLEAPQLDNSTSLSNPQTSNIGAIINVINSPFKNQDTFEKVFCFIWLFGIVLFMGILIVGHRKLRKIVSISTKNISINHREILYKCMKAMDIKTKVELSYSSKISSPSLCGLIKPKILIPVTVATNISDEEFKYIIIHELIHLKSKDIFINWVTTLLSVIYWFNPILIFGFHKMKQDCEFSCDGQAISYLNEGENLKYGNAIIRVLELASSSNRLIGTTSMVMKKSEIKRRIVMISKYKKVNIKNIILGTIIVVIIGGLGIALNTTKSVVKTSMDITKEFGRNFYGVDALKIVDYKKMLITMDNLGLRIGEGVTVIEANKTAEDNYNKTLKSFDKNIQPLMTKTGYDATVANRFNTLSSEVCDKGNYTLQLTDIILEKNLYGEKEDKAGYHYEAKLKFTSTNGKVDRTDTSKGYIGLLKENGQWKVSINQWDTYPKLFKEILINRF